MLIHDTMELGTQINVGGFGDAAEMEWQTVKSWDSFTDFFEGAVRVEAVTYCESPELLLDLFERESFDLETVGHRIDCSADTPLKMWTVDVLSRLFGRSASVGHANGSDQPSDGCR